MGELPTGYIGYPEDPDYEMAFMREKAERERDHARAGLREIQELHSGVDALMNPGRHERLVKVCTGCGTDDGNYQLWPCPTRQLADKALSQESEIDE